MTASLSDIAIALAKALAFAFTAVAAFQIARRGARAPSGWWLLLAAFMFAFARAVLSVGADVTGGATAAELSHMAALSTVPMTAFFFLGVASVYLWYRGGSARTQIAA